MAELLRKFEFEKMAGSRFLHRFFCVAAPAADESSFENIRQFITTAAARIESQLNGQQLSNGGIAGLLEVRHPT